MKWPITKAIYHDDLLQLARLVVNAAPVEAKGFRMGKRLSSYCILVAYDAQSKLVGFKSIEWLSTLCSKL